MKWMTARNAASICSTGLELWWCAAGRRSLQVSSEVPQGENDRGAFPNPLSDDSVKSTGAFSSGWTTDATASTEEPPQDQNLSAVSHRISL